MLYFDTSFFTPLIRAEATTAHVQRFVAGLPKEQLTTSHWTRVEFSSVLAREVRMGRLDPRDAAAVDARFEALVTAALSCCCRPRRIMAGQSAISPITRPDCGHPTHCIWRSL
jgi:predicted nucleic acid-binding protein